MMGDTLHDSNYSLHFRWKNTEATVIVVCIERVQFSTTSRWFDPGGDQPTVPHGCIPQAFLDI